MAEQEEWVRSGEVCAALHITNSTLRWHCKRGTLPWVMTPGGHRRFRRADLDALLATLERHGIPAA